MKDVLSAQQNRFSTRKFQDKVLSNFELETLETAALNAPTAMNRQELRFAFIQRQDILSRLDEKVRQEMEANNPEAYRSFLQRMAERGSDSVFYGAPLVIVITGSPDSYSPVNAGIAVQNLALAAEALGLGSCIIGMIRDCFKAQDPDNCLDLIGAEKGNIFHIAIAIGYKAEDKTPHSYDYDHIIHLD
ncbi:MAG: nitroreductase family protein [Eubacteriales bacterium]|nr:nitroreductase family protein [Clostridiales bacterium]MDY5836798.1 nitroreductase family protein [Eubacteriales bacterium]